jgi:hypothetical protein
MPLSVNTSVSEYIIEHAGELAVVVADQEFAAGDLT